jgi:hypothetical protein
MKRDAAPQQSSLDGVGRCSAAHGPNADSRSCRDPKQTVAPTSPLLWNFIGMGATVLAIVLGSPPKRSESNGFHDTFATGAPILLFLALVLLLGVYIPPPLESLLRDAAACLEVTR